MLGAFGAHALGGLLDAQALGVWHTAVEYQFWHALALLGVAVMVRSEAGVAVRIAGFAWALGIVLFCGSLYLLALGAPRAVGFVTPLGGLAFMIGWIALGVAAWRGIR
ncbi:MAG: DUF423 domain-containing protein [Rhodanobacteraceae bacterium]